MGMFADLFERDLMIRGHSENTRRVYICVVRNFARFFGRSPDKLTIEHVNQYQHYLVRDKKASRGYFNVVVSALRFFYQVTLRKNWDFKRIPYRKTGQRLPEILSQQELVRFFAAIRNLKHRALLMTIYATGVRVSEALHLRLSDIDSQRMLNRSNSLTTGRWHPPAASFIRFFQTSRCGATSERILWVYGNPLRKPLLLTCRYRGT